LAAIFSGCTLLTDIVITPRPADLTAAWKTPVPTSSPTLGVRPTPGDFTCPTGELPPILPDNAAEVIEIARLAPDGLSDVALSPNGSLMAILTEQEALLYSLDCSQEVAPIAIKEFGSLVGHALADESLALSFEEQGVQLWRLPEGAEGSALPAEARRLAFSPDGSLLATVGSDNALELWQVDTGERLHSVVLRRPAANLGFSPDGSTLAVELEGDLDDPVELWDVSSGELRQTFSWSERAGPIYFVRFAPDWGTLAWVSRATVLIMDAESGLEQAVLGHEDYVDALAYSPDGTLAAITSAAEVAGEFLSVVVLWDVDSGRETALLFHAEPITGLAFSPDGGVLATATLDGTIGLWEIVEAERVVRLGDQVDVSRSLFFALDGRLLISVSIGGRVQFWGLEAAVP
jgi:WD40 repeat protein